jgi:hypothetical protein
VTSRKRVFATLNRQPTDPPPWIETGFHPTIVSALTGKAVHSGVSDFFPLDGGTSPDNVRAIGGTLRELSYERP